MSQPLHRWGATLIRTGLLALLVAIAAPPPADAQSPGERLKKRIQQKIDQRTDQVLDEAVDAADRAIVCVVTDSECIEGAKARDQPITYTDSEGNPAPDPDPVVGHTAAPGEGVWANFDFVPGARVIFTEDFTRDRVGNFPRRLEFHDGNLEVVDWNGRRWLRANPGGTFSIPLPEVLPEKFTLAFDVTIPWYGLLLWGTPVDESGEGPRSTASVEVNGQNVGLARGGGLGGSGMSPVTLIPGLKDRYDGALLSDPVRIRVMGDGAYVKVYLDEHRVSNVPNADFARTTSLSFRFADNVTGQLAQPPLITDIVVAASKVSLYDALLSGDRVATRGIQFDTGRDRVRPESSGTLAEIAAVLRQNAEIRLLIEGHTDGVGDATTNRTLSEARAAAVKDALVSHYGIASARLETVGLGASAPVADDATPEGRQQNRRVELVRR
jgi:OmpA-OmpF porin, OOP family